MLMVEVLYGITVCKKPAQGFGTLILLLDI